MVSSVSIHPAETLASQVRVVHFGNYYPPHRGGIESHLKQICEATSWAVSPRVVVSHTDAKREDEVINHIPVARLATFGKLASMPLTPGFFLEASKIDADIVHVHHPNPIATLAILGSISRRTRLIVTYHSDVVNQKYLRYGFAPAVHSLLKRADAIIATSPNYIEASPYLGKYRDKCCIIPLGIDVEGFRRQASRDAVEKLRAGATRPILLAAGRLVRYKGLEYLIDAMRQIDAELWIVGDGPLKNSLAQRSAPIHDKVRFFGAVENIADYYAACDLFVFPSINRSEAFGIAQMEAMAMGKPVVNTLLDSGVPFVSLDRVSGLSVPPFNPEALAQAINLLITDCVLLNQMSLGALERVRSQFDVSKMASRTLELYESLLGRTFVRAA